MDCYACMPPIIYMVHIPRFTLFIFLFLSLTVHWRVIHIHCLSFTQFIYRVLHLFVYIVHLPGSSLFIVYIIHMPGFALFIYEHKSHTRFCIVALIFICLCLLFVFLHFSIHRAHYRNNIITISHNYCVKKITG